MLDLRARPSFTVLLVGVMIVGSLHFGQVQLEAASATPLRDAVATVSVNAELIQAAPTSGVRKRDYAKACAWVGGGVGLFFGVREGMLRYDGWNDRVYLWGGSFAAVSAAAAWAICKSR